MCVCAGLNTLLVYLACSLCCAMYTILVFFLPRLMGIRPSMAMAMSVRGGEGDGYKVVGIISALFKGQIM